MNQLLFTALLLALLYYFFYYLPSQKKLVSNPPLTHSLFTQTEPTPRDEKELAELKTKHQALETKLKDHQTRLKDKESQITNLQQEIRTLAQRPVKPTNSQSTQTASETELTNTLDTLIKEIQDLNNSLD